MGIGSNLWSWQRAQVTVKPRNPRLTTSMRSSMISFWSSRNRRPTVRNPIAASGPPVAAAGELIGGELLHDELVVAQVGIERRDHVVAVGVGKRIAPILGEHIALRVGVAGHVEPVPAPALAVAGRREQAVDQLRERIGRLVGLERVDLLGGRRNAPEVDRRAADQRSLRGAGARGSSPAASSRAITNASTGDCTSARFLTAGGETGLMGRNAQCVAASGAAALAGIAARRR